MHTHIHTNTHTHLDGHASAVEAKRKEDLLATELHVTGSKLGLGHGEHVAQMQQPVHVRVWEAHKVCLIGVLLAILLSSSKESQMQVEGG